MAAQATDMTPPATDIPPPGPPPPPATPAPPAPPATPPPRAPRAATVPSPGTSIQHLFRMGDKLKNPFTSNQLRTHLKEWEWHWDRFDYEVLPNTTTWPATAFARTLPRNFKEAVLRIWKEGNDLSWPAMKRIALNSADTREYQEKEIAKIAAKKARLVAAAAPNIEHLAALLSTKLEPPFTTNQLYTHLEEWEAHYLKLEPKFVPNTTIWPARTFAKTLPFQVEAALMSLWNRGTRRNWDEMRRIVRCAGRNWNYRETMVCWERWCEYCRCLCHSGEEFPELPVCDAIAEVNHTSRVRRLAESAARFPPVFPAALFPPPPFPALFPPHPSIAYPYATNPMFGPPPTAPRFPIHIPPLSSTQVLEAAATTGPVGDQFGTPAHSVHPERPPAATVIISAYASHCVVKDKTLLVGLRPLALPVLVDTGIGGEVEASYEGKLVLWCNDTRRGVVVEHVLYAPESRHNVLKFDGWLCHQLNSGTRGLLRSTMLVLQSFFAAPRQRVSNSICTLFWGYDCPEPTSLRQVVLVRLRPPPETPADRESIAMAA